MQERIPAERRATKKKSHEKVSHPPSPHPSSHNENFASVSYYPQYGPPGPYYNVGTGTNTNIMYPPISSQKVTSYPSNNNTIDGSIVHEYAALPPYAVVITPQYSDIGTDPFVLEKPSHISGYYMSSVTSNSTSSSSTTMMMESYPTHHHMYQDHYHPRQPC